MALNWGCNRWGKHPPAWPRRTPGKFQPSQKRELSTREFKEISLVEALLFEKIIKRRCEL